MTIATRNHFFRAGILLSLIILVLAAAAAYRCIGLIPATAQMADGRPAGLLRVLAMFRPVPWVPLAGMGFCVLFALCGLVLVLYWFEKTSTPEILFVAFFILSLAFEAARIILPLSRAWNLAGVFSIIAQRILLFARTGGTFSLFTASICAAGLDTKRQSSIILVIVLAALVIALSLPLDMLSWDTTFSLSLGYETTLMYMETGIGLIAALSFAVSSRVRGAREYLAAGGGALLAFAGRGILIRADSWFVPLPGLLLLVLGTAVLCACLHRIYLWR